MEKNPFSYFDFGQSSSTAIKGTASSAYGLLMAIGIIGLVVTIILIGIKLSFGGAARRAEALEELKWKAAAAVVLFSMTTIVSWILKIAGSFGG